MKVGFTEDALKALEKAGITDDILKQLIHTVQNHHRSKHTVEAFDGVSCLGVPLSWLRNWNTGEAVIMTRAEARMLDGSDSNKYEFPFNIKFPF